MTSRKDCSQEHLFSAYLDGELAEDAARSFEQHLENCRRCSLLCNDMKSNDRVLIQALPEMEVPAQLKSQLFRRINVESQRSETPVFFEKIRQSFSFSLRPWAYACAPIVVFAFIISAIHLQHRIENGKLLAEIDRSRTEWSARDGAANPFNIDINGSPLHLAGKNPFEAYLNER